MEKHNDELSKTLNWRVETLNSIFIPAIDRYVEVLQLYTTEGNTELFREYEAMQRFRDYFQEQADNADGGFDMVEVILLGKNWGKMYDLLWKYNSWKKQLFNEKERVILIKAALEGDKKHLDMISGVLQYPCWDLFIRQPILVDSLYNSPSLKTKDPVIQQFFNVETLNGILTGTNNGVITQNIESKEVLNSIQEIAEILKKEPLEDKNKAEAFSNLQDLQGELLKPYPDSSKMKKAADGLQLIANISQIASFVMAIQPHLQRIQLFISQFTSSIK